MAYELIAPPGLSATLLPNRNSVLLSWSPYAPADAAGHHVIGYRLFRSPVVSAPGPMIASEFDLGPGATSYTDVDDPIFGQDVYYTLVAVECTDYGARPYGEAAAPPANAEVPYGV
jgi:hypothetical protein